MGTEGCTNGKLLVNDQEVFVNDDLLDQCFDVLGNLAAGLSTNLVEELLNRRIHGAKMLHVRRGGWHVRGCTDQGRP